MLFSWMGPPADGCKCSVSHRGESDARLQMRELRFDDKGLRVGLRLRARPRVRARERPAPIDGSRALQRCQPRH